MNGSAKVKRICRYIDRWLGSFNGVEMQELSPFVVGEFSLTSATHWAKPVERAG